MEKGKPQRGPFPSNEALILASCPISRQDNNTSWKRLLRRTDALAGSVTAASGFIGHFIGRSVILNHPRHPNCFPFIHFVPISGTPPLRRPVSLVIQSPHAPSLAFSSLPGLAEGDDKGGSNSAAGVPS
ncbi:hypothetical protein E2C01_087657 [Portunus trituberculatus]|uniref:Uncharacterized protein n=1 Tax=Portunus trituberculatus TaxID=210409 RepID=A0A5B7J8R3_PORTR|nr:hypothetical protein [Portunus trituberculatus]